MGHIHFLNLTYDIEESKRQRHATLPFLKIDMQHRGPPIKGPNISVGTALQNTTACVLLLQVSRRMSFYNITLPTD